MIGYIFDIYVDINTIFVYFEKLGLFRKQKVN